MKFTLNWLKDHLDTTASLDEITETLTRIGLEVEDITDPSATLAPFIVAEVISAEKHPNADKLKVCMVNTGRETLQVVCGAPNAKAGMKGVFAASGTTIPSNGMVLKPTKIRDVESNGMLCSERELELSDEHDGIIELTTDAPAGTPFAEVAGLNDPIIEIAITPNRQDCLGVYGIARDLAAAGLGTLKESPTKPVKAAFDGGQKIVTKDSNACPVFLGRVVRGVKNGPSPEWMQQRLRAIGLRPISALVDMTNYMSYDRARPLHVYDMAKLNGTVTARLGKTGETFTALDGNEYTLAGGECVIADDKSVLGLGGVMGGEDSGCTEATTDVLIECALFDPIRTAETGRRHQIDSDARYRFERGVDPGAMMDGIEHATAMVLDMCGGKPGDIITAGATPDVSRTIEFHPERIETLGGLKVSEKDACKVLEKLGFIVTPSKGLLQVDIPSWRCDIVGEADLVEEVLRIIGYDTIPSVPLTSAPVPVPVLTDMQKRARATRRALATQGLHECVTYSFMRSDQAKLFGAPENIRLANPISSEMDMMRPSILPNLMAAAGRNMDRGQKRVALFEIGPEYHGLKADEQFTMATGLRAGKFGPRTWEAKTENVSVFDAKRDALIALAAMGVPTDNLMVMGEAPSWYHPGRSGTLRLGPKNILATFGELHPAVLKAMDVDGPMVGFEINLAAAPATGRKGTTRPALQLNDLQVVERDFAFLMDADAAVQDLIRAISGVDKKHIRDVSVFDVYQGKDLPEGKVSIAISVALAPTEKTFTDAEIEAIATKIIQTVEVDTKLATLRK